MNSLRSTKSLIIAVGFAAVGQAQNPLQEYQKAYPDINEVVLSDFQSYNFSIENKKLKVIQDNHYESIILSENGIQNNEESFSYSELVKLKSYDAYSVVYEKGREKKIKVSQTNEKNARDNSVFYNDVKERQLIFPNLEAGAKKVYNYQTEFLDPYLLHKFIFGGGLPVKNSTLEITADKDINVGYKMFNDPNGAVEFSKTEKRGKVVYRWTLKDAKPFKMEGNMPGVLYSIPHIDVYIKDYTVDDKPIQVLDDTDELFAYYQGFVKDLNKKESPELKAASLDITRGLKTDEEKVKSIFYWVKDNVKYIAFENGYEGFIPREGALVFERKFGDCKDMASLITAMCHYAGVKDVSISWIGTRRIPYSYKELSTPAVDDHMIAVFKKGSEYIFLDATDKETRYGIPTAFIQGKEAMYNLGDTYKIIPVPVVPAEENQISEITRVSVDKDKLTGSGKVEFRGYNRSHILAAIGDATNKTRFEMVKGLVLKGNNKFNLKKYDEENIQDRDKPYGIAFDFDLENYIIKVGKETYINLFLDKPYEKVTIEKDRVSKFEFDYLTYNNFKYELEIPANTTVKYLPKDFRLDNALMWADFSYQHKDGKLTLNIQTKLKKLMLDNGDFDLWNETIKQLKSNYTETIILSEK